MELDATRVVRRRGGWSLVAAWVVAMAAAGVFASPAAYGLSSTPDSEPNEAIDEFAGIHVDGEVMAIAHGAEGMAYIGGDFSHVCKVGGVDCQKRENIAQLDQQGQVTFWNPDANGNVRALAVSPDGKTVYAGGEFSPGVFGGASIGGAKRDFVAALDARGQATQWAPQATDVVRALAVSASGETVYVGGDFDDAGQHGFTESRPHLAAIEADSDGRATAWDPKPSGQGGETTVRAIDLSADGSTVYVAGYFTSVGGAGRTSAAALSTAGTGTATSWDPHLDLAGASDDTDADDVEVSPDGTTVYIAGGFDRAGTNGAAVHNIAKLSAASGAADAAFHPDPQGNNSESDDPQVASLALDWDTSSLYVGGTFTSIDGAARNGLAELDPQTGAVGGWAPDVKRTNFDQKRQMVSVVETLGSTLDVGGGFDHFGSGQRRAYARFGGPPVNRTPPRVEYLTAPAFLDCDSNTEDWQGTVTSIAFKWQRVTAGGLVDIPGADQQVYEPVAADLGHELRCAAAATNSHGTSLYTTSSNELPFGPTFDAVTVSDITGTTAKLADDVNPNSMPSDVSFTYRPVVPPGPAHTTPEQDIGAGASPVTVQRTLSGLAAGTEYEVWAQARTSFGTVDSQPAVFQTESIPPTVQTLEGEWDGSRFLMRGSVDPNNSPARYWFEYSRSPDFPAGQTCVRPAGKDGGPVTGAAPDLVEVQTDVVDAGGPTPPCELAQDATYFFRLLAYNAVNGVDDPTVGNTSAFVTHSGPLDVQTSAASNVTARAATLNGRLDPAGFDAQYWFQWGRSDSYGQATAPVPVTATNGTVPAVTALAGLEPNTTYHYRLAAANVNGQAFGADRTFTTGAIPADVTTGPATADPSAQAATLTGTVNPNGAATTYQFEYGLTDAYGDRAPIPPGGAGSGSVAEPVSQLVRDLLPNRTYHYRLSATNAAGTVHGADATFELDLPPGVSIAPATGIDTGSATLNGTVEPNNAPTRYHFEYGTTPRYGQSTPVRDAGSGGPPLSPANVVEVAETLTGLRPGTVYHARVVAVHADGSRSASPDLAFTTATPAVPIVPAPPGSPTVPAETIHPPDAPATTPPAPRARTGPVLRLHRRKGTARVRGWVVPRGQPTVYWAQYGHTRRYGHDSDHGSLAPAPASVPVGLTLTDLRRASTWHYRVIAANANGISVGADRVLVTRLRPHVRPVRCARVRVAYRSPVHGRLRVRVRARIAGKTRIVASRSIRLRPGQRSRTTIRLTRPARRILHHRHLRVRVHLSLRPSSGVGPAAKKRRTLPRCLRHG